MAHVGLRPGTAVGGGQGEAVTLGEISEPPGLGGSRGPQAVCPSAGLNLPLHAQPAGSVPLSRSPLSVRREDPGPAQHQRQNEGGADGGLRAPPALIAVPGRARERRSRFGARRAESSALLCPSPKFPVCQQQPDLEPPRDGWEQGVGCYPGNPRHCGMPWDGHAAQRLPAVPVAHGILATNVVWSSTAPLLHGAGCRSPPPGV